MMAAQSPQSFRALRHLSSSQSIALCYLLVILRVLVAQRLPAFIEAQFMDLQASSH
jgi:hypothetical protein